MNINKIQSEIETKLVQELQDKVEFTLLFGSVLTENFRESSDIDVAVYFKERFNNTDFYLELIGNLAGQFNQQIDLVKLNTADTIITMQVLANGKLIINNNPSFFIRYKALKISEYCDFKLSRRIIENNMLQGRIYA